MKKVMIALALFSAPAYSMELTPNKSTDAHTPTTNTYTPTILCDKENRALFETSVGKAYIYWCGKFPQTEEFTENTLFHAEKNPYPAVSPDSDWVACVRGNKNIIFFPWGRPEENEEITFKEKLHHLVWLTNKIVFAATKKKFCACILSDPIQFLEGKLPLPPVSKIYPIDETTFAYASSAHEILFCSLFKNVLTTRQQFNAPIIDCAYHTGIFGCLDSENTIHVLNTQSMSWQKTIASVENPYKVALRLKGTVFLLAIASKDRPKIEIVVRQEGAGHEFVSKEEFDSTIEEMAWTNENELLCIGSNKKSYTVDVSKSLELADQS